ncbi:uroporphyrinogen-III synthase [Sodiomyces alkalinus F11]|uniref:Uroporphyrinogen-III synthase n=1 Tax=Sodiomyces alkalinus (strain CBS 110278 / VKM F-3762 / F11) TaxID=1314773 RepID=A0A3N2Q7G4_SODAK|nr:uroporphyrinogen-III synthase [Sodiomyces alkalinus F11]ROT42723.1 uroporphyrinogen-III synthase [Sodiomyces alkalinus F11]
MTSVQLTSNKRDAVPVFLLKTKSATADSYEELFSEHRDGGPLFEPTFVPVLQHEFKDDGLEFARDVLRHGKVGIHETASFGGLVFTSQRAVETFANLVAEPMGTAGEPSWPNIQSVPVYSVGPATTRALKAIPQTPGLQVHGSHTGVGDALAPFILDHYGAFYAGRSPKPPLLFLVGEQRRDVIPKVLMDPALPVDRRIEVTEVVVYSTNVMRSFAENFVHVLEATSGRPMRWIVVFSPTGCGEMLRGLGILDEVTGRAKAKIKEDDRSTFVATIGPTTRDHLWQVYGFKADVCAEHPTAEGVYREITNSIESQAQRCPSLS